jgi:hypothetical protein
MFGRLSNDLIKPSAYSVDTKTLALFANNLGQIGCLWSRCS